MWQIVFKQDNLYIQVCFFRNSVLKDNNASSTKNTFSETLINNKKEFLKNQFLTTCVQDKKYQQILKVFKIEIRTIKNFFLTECTIVNN